MSQMKCFGFCITHVLHIHASHGLINCFTEWLTSTTKDGCHKNLRLLVTMFRIYVSCENFDTFTSLLQE